MGYFYFICYVGLDRKSLTVIDQDNCVDYDRSDFNYINFENFDNHLSAIAHARLLAEMNNLEYKLFNSRYDKSLNETLDLQNE